MILRSATPADAGVLRGWEGQEHVWTARGYEDVADWQDNGAINWENDLLRKLEWREWLIGECEGRSVGFMEIIDPYRDEEQYWGEIEPNLRAIDIWIGNASDVGRGFGSAMMRLAIERCFDDVAVNAIVVDPLFTNVRAQRFYARLGFRPAGRRDFGGDDCLVMCLERESR